MKRKSILDVGEWWKMGEIHHYERNCKMILFWWREKVGRMLVNDERLLKFMIFREILKWFDFDEENRYIKCWSMKKD